MYVYKLCVQVPEEVRKELCFVAKADLELPDHLTPRALELQNILLQLLL